VRFVALGTGIGLAALVGYFCRVAVEHVQGFREVSTVVMFVAVMVLWRVFAHVMRLRDRDEE